MIRVATDLYYLPSTVDQVRDVLKKFLSEKGEITAASFRDLIGSSRKYTIPLLEYFDREGLTIRIGDVRRLKSSSAAGNSPGLFVNNDGGGAGLSPAPTKSRIEFESQ